MTFISSFPLDSDCRLYSTSSSHTNLKEKGMPWFNWLSTKGIQSSYKYGVFLKKEREWISSAFYICHDFYYWFPQNYKHKS